MTLADLFPISLDDQVAAVRREIAMRERVYPRLIVKGSLTRQKADRELAVMRAVLATLLLGRQP